MTSIFSVLDQKNPFWVNLAKKIEIVSLSGNSVPRLIWICGVQWWCSLFQFLTGNTVLGKFGPKNQTCQFELKFGTRLIWICRIMQKICGVHFLCFGREKLFLGKSYKKIKIVSLSWFLVPRLIWICGIHWWCSLFLFWAINVFLGQIWYT